MDRIICVVGPTASGKTKLAVQLAKAYDGEVVSCDSMQIYKHMDIGTAKPMPEEMEGVPHHMIDCVEPGEDFSVGKYVQLADGCVQDILSRGKTAVIAGGTGLYVDSLIAGRTFAPVPQTGKREALEAQLRQEGGEAMLRKLRAVDPDAAARLHPADEKRIIRALEVYAETGRTITQHNLDTQQIPPRYRPVWIGLDYLDRAVLYRRIDLRVDLMMKNGLLAEVEKLKEMGCTRDMVSMQGLGYKEILDALDGTISLDEAVYIIKRDTRHFAKRQLTWFKREKEVTWVDQGNFDFDREKILVWMLEDLRERNIMAVRKKEKSWNL